ncbi:MAG: two-component regulator propeller domain-containing protein [Calditrichaceae bacterium]
MYQSKFNLKVNFILLIFIVLNVAVANESRPQKLRFKHLTVDQGLSHTGVFDILKDKYNFMWFATANGLNKYDGYEFEVFQHSSTDSNSLSQSLISDLFEDSNGTLWIATGDGLSRFNRARNNFKNYYPDSSLNSILGRIIQTIVEDDQGRIWVATTQGLNLYHPETDSFTRFGYADQGFEQISIESPRGDMLADGGTIWIGTLEYSLIKFDIKKKKFKQYIPGKYNENNRSDNSVTSLEKSGNILWIGTLGNGLFKLNLSKNEDVRFFQYKHDPANPNSLNNDNIMDLLIESESKIWIGTINYGLDLFNPQEGVFLHNMPDRNIPSSLNNGSIFSIYVDDAKNIWVGTYAGGVNVSYVNLQNIQLYRDVGGTKNSMSGNMVTSFLEDKKGNLWVGTDGGGLNYLNRKDNTFKKYSTRNTNLNSDAIHSLSYDKHYPITIFYHL